MSTTKPGDRLVQAPEIPLMFASPVLDDRQDWCAEESDEYERLSGVWILTMFLLSGSLVIDLNDTLKIQ